MPNCCSPNTILTLYFRKYRLVFNIERGKIATLFLVSLARRHFLSCCLPVPNNTASTLDTVCALEKILLLYSKRFNHQEQRCGTKGEPFTFFLQFTKGHASKASLKHPHVLQRALLFHRHFSEASAIQLLKRVVEVHVTTRLTKPRKLSRYF